MAKIDDSVYLAKGSFVLGDVEVGADCGIWYNAVVRGDSAPIRIGKETNVQDCAVLHVDEGHPMKIGDGVTIGHGAIVHSCTVGDNTIIGMGAIILNDAVVGRNCMIGAGSLVPQGAEIPDGSIAFGSPAKVRRPMTEEEIAYNRLNAAVYIRHAKEAKESEE